MASRWLLAFLIVGLASAGCVSSVEDAPVESASVEDSSPPESASTDSAEPQASEPPSQGSSSTQSPPPPSEQEPETPREAPEQAPPPSPRPWSLWGAVTVGFARGIGAGGAEDGTPAGGAAPQETDAAHCSNATFLVPPGASTLTFNISSTVASPNGPSAGMMAVVFTSPSGVSTAFDPARDAPNATENERNGTFRMPEPGAWVVKAKAIGPVVSQAWSVDLVLTGESFGGLPVFTAASGCT